MSGFDIPVYLTAEMQARREKRRRWMKGFVALAVLVLVIAGVVQSIKGNETITATVCTTQWANGNYVITQETVFRFDPILFGEDRRNRRETRLAFNRIAKHRTYEITYEGIEWPDGYYNIVSMQEVATNEAAVAMCKRFG